MSIQNKQEAAQIVRLINEGKLTGDRKTQALSDLRKFDRVRRPSSMTQLVGAPAMGFNVGYLADTLGLPVDAMNAVIKGADLGLEMLGVPEDFIQPSEAPFGGSESIKRALIAGGMGANKEDLPIDQRALFEGGRVVGQGFGAATPVFGMARTMSPAKAMMDTIPKGSVAKNIATDMVKSTARSPGRMAALEGGALVGAGQGRAIGETIAPDNEFVGMSLELLGGVVNPLSVGKTLTDRAKKSLEGLTTAGREEAARRKITEILEENKFLTRDPEVDDRRLSDLTKQLRKSEGPATTAQVTENPEARKVFTAIENKLKSADDELKTAIETQTKKSIDKFNKTIRELNNSGNPLAVKEAQRMRIEFTNKKLDAMVEKAQDRASSAVSRVLTKNKDDAAKASAEAREIIDSELKIARNMENTLWDEVDKSVDSPTDQTIKVFNEIKDEISPNEQVMRPLEGFIQGLIKRRDASLEQRPGRGFMATAQRQGFQPLVRVGAKELFRKRSVALRLARQEYRKGNFNDAKNLNDLADAMLKDLDKVTDPTANVARNFSNSLNTKFNTKLIRDARAADPGVFFEKTGKGSDAQRALNFQALKRATKRDVDTMETGTTTELLNKLERDFMESAASSVVDPFTNKIKPKDLSRFINNNKLTLREVGMLDDINDVDKKVKLATKLQNTAKNGRAFIKKKTLAAQIAKGSDNLSEVLTKAFDSNYQTEAFKDLVRTVNRSKNSDAIEGLRHGVFDELTKRATITDGNLEGLISGKNLEQVLNNKVGNKTLRQNLIDTGLITPEQSANLTKVIKAAKIFEDAATDPRKLNTLISTGDGMINLLARNLGARLGSAMAGDSPSIVMAGVGSRKAVGILEKIPALKVQGVLTKAIQDPKFMAYLLEKRPRPQKQLDQKIRAYLLQAGLLESFPTGAVTDEFEEEMKNPSPQAQTLRDSMDLP